MKQHTTHQTFQLLRLAEALLVDLPASRPNIPRSSWRPWSMLHQSSPPMVSQTRITQFYSHFWTVSSMTCPEEMMHVFEAKTFWLSTLWVFGGPGWTSVKKAFFCVHFTTKPKSQWPSQVASDSIWLMLQGLPRPFTSESVWRSLNHTLSSAQGPAGILPTGQSQLPAEIHRLDVMKRQWSDCGSNPQIMYGP